MGSSHLIRPSPLGPQAWIGKVPSAGSALQGPCRSGLFQLGLLPGLSTFSPSALVFFFKSVPGCFYSFSLFHSALVSSCCCAKSNLEKERVKLQSSLCKSGQELKLKPWRSTVTGSLPHSSFQVQPRICTGNGTTHSG